MCGATDEREQAASRLPLSRTYDGLRVLGLTGPAAGGKSFLLSLLGEAGACTIEADALYRDLVAPGSALLSRINEAFPGVLAADGSLDRARLARIVFSEPASLARLNRIVHPALGEAVAQATAAAAGSGAGRIAIEAAVLFDIGSDALCDEVWFVECPVEERVRRLQASRGWDEPRARRLVEGQGDMAHLRGRCSRVIDGTAPRADLAKIALEWIRGG